MSDPPIPDSPTDAPAPAGTLDFQRAEPVEPAPEQVACAFCKRAIAAEYWQYAGKIVCETCRDSVRHTVADARRAATLGKAFLLGGVVALGCGIGYAVFAGLTKGHLALVTIGIGWAVGRSIQRITRGFGSRKHQVLAVALTYCASSMGYLPAVFEALSSSAHHAAPGAAATTSPSSAPSSASADTAAATEAPPPPANTPPAGGRFGVVASIFIFLGVTGFLTLAAPFFGISSGLSGLLGLAIIFFGLRTAWQVSRGANTTITGPYKLDVAAGS